MGKIEKVEFLNKRKPGFNFDLLKLEELLCKNIDHDPTKPHEVLFFHLLIITEGEGSHQIDFIDYEVGEGAILTIRKDQIHSFYQNPGVKGFLLLFTDEFLASQYGENEVFRAFQLFNELIHSPIINLQKKEFKEILYLIYRIQNEYKKNEDEFSLSIIRSYLHLIIIRVFRIKSKENCNFGENKYYDLFLQLQQYIEQNYSKTRRVFDYANMMNCSTKTLNNLCRSILGKPAKSVIDDIVIIHIKRLLINTHLQVSEIAYKVGFIEPANMYRYFKKYTKYSPEAFRRANLK